MEVPSKFNRFSELESLIHKNLVALFLKIGPDPEHSGCGDAFFVKTVEGGGKEVSALCDFIQRFPMTEEEFGIDQELSTLYCIAYEFLALKRKKEIPSFILTYRDLFLKQLDKGDIEIEEMTPREAGWLKLIEMREDLKLNYQPGTTVLN